ncbi:MAG: MBOAT family O-acyltransferase [Sphingobacteriaceae bacterium]
MQFDPEQPLLFTHLFFWGFFAVVLLGYTFIYKQNKARSIYLLLFSFFFYYKTNGVFITLLFFTIISDFYWGKRIAASSNQSHKKLFLTISVLLNLTLLCYFKYAYFFASSSNQLFGTNFTYFNHFANFSNTFFGTEFRLDKLLTPIGVSFFTFQSLSYTIDVYRDKVKPVTNVFDYGFFVCFFPHLVAGPIVKAHEFLYQIYQPYSLTKFEFGMATFWIMNGFAKKIVADYIAVNFIDRVFSSPHLYTGVEAVMAIFSYSLQVYMDFSGYTDMAIGIALLLGYRLKTNFKSPYKALSTSEFWKRWHISLSSWLQEYLYIPLGGNKTGTIGSYICIIIISAFMVLLSGKIWLLYVLIGFFLLLIFLSVMFPTIKQNINTNINLMVTMLLGGLWHGSSWLFLIWGGLNGLGLIIHKFWQKISPFKNTESVPVKIVLMLITLTFISFTRIYFRSPSLDVVNEIYDRIGNHFSLYLFFDIVKGYWAVLLVVFLGFLVHWIPETYKEKYRNAFANLPIPGLVFACVFIVFCLYQIMSSQMQPFIYFQF